MIEINGEYASAKIFVTNNEETAIEGYALDQIKALCNNNSAIDSKIRVMPDVHPGAGCVIGLTMTVHDKIMPNLVGVDIGCGVTIAKLKVKAKDLDFNKLDKVIREEVPSGFSVRTESHTYADLSVEQLRCGKHMNIERANLSIGTLGGGNHFIEVDKDDEGNLYLVVHSGSRHLGVEITEWYLKQGQAILKDKGFDIPYEMTYLEDELKDDYLYDLEQAQMFAADNRLAIIDVITKSMKWKTEEIFSSIHNYVDFSDPVNPILRKGAISAAKDKRLIIPINMRDGVILGTGLGNEDWNYSAPHGAGRIMSRKQAKNSFTVSAFKKEMKDIHCTCVCDDTLDESPFAYRNIEDILEVIGDTIKIDKIIKPIYNFKASEVQPWQKGKK